MSRLQSNQLCACGCGEYTLISNQGKRKGKPNKFLKDHMSKGKNHPAWNGGQIVCNGYVLIYKPKHPCSKKDGYIKRSRLVVEKALGKYLPLNICIHHVDGIKSNDASNNLMACENTGYHSYIHARQRALIKSGHANWRACVICGEYNDPELLRKYGKRYFHGSCIRKYAKEHYYKNKRKNINV